MIPRPPSRDLTRITLAVLVIGLLIVACLWILQPFLGATVWATMIVVATWPMMLGLQARLGGQRWKKWDAHIILKRRAFPFTFDSQQ